MWCTALKRAKRYRVQMAEKLEAVELATSADTSIPATGTSACYCAERELQAKICYPRCCSNQGASGGSVCQERAWNCFDKIVNFVHLAVVHCSWSTALYNTCLHTKGKQEHAIFSCCTTVVHLMFIFWLKSLEARTRILVIRSDRSRRWRRRRRCTCAGQLLTAPR